MSIELRLLKQDIEEIGNRIDSWDYKDDLDAMFADLDAYQNKWSEYTDKYKEINGQIYY